MVEVRLTGGSVTAASFVLGRKLDSIPFSAYHLLIITVLALVGFIEGYDLVITGSLLVLAKGPLHLLARHSCCASGALRPQQYPTTGAARA